MLTSTYTLVALKIEQAGVRAGLTEFQEYSRTHYQEAAPVSLRELDEACATLHRLYRSSTWRKVEIFLIPALRKATRQCDQLLAELGALTYQAYTAFDNFEARLRDASADPAVLSSQLRKVIDAFCSALLTRLEREENELLPVARTVIPGDTWFAIANQSLVHDERMQERRSASHHEEEAVQLQLI
jgi:hypothetical protein